MKFTYIYIIIMLSVPKLVFSESLHYPILNNLVQYAGSVDAYSSMCVQKFQADIAEDELFSMIEELSMNLNLSEKDIFKLRDKYFRISKSTLSQLTQLGLAKSKNLCGNYLKIFERFDEKRKEKLDEILILIDEN